MTVEQKPLRAAGGCLCGKVRYEVRGKLGPVYACHCSQCRRTTGYCLVTTSTRRANFHLVRDATLRWYESSPRARRGFCAACGSTLFWDAPEENYICMTAGSIDPPTGLALECHIYTEDKGDFYEIADGLRSMPQGSAG